LRILAVNYRYFVSGGPERSLFSLQNLLTKKGHEIIPFSIRYKQNYFTPYAKYFVPPIAGDEEVLFKEYSWSLKSFNRGLSRLFYSKEVEKATERIIAETKPDIALIFHYLRKLSPSVLVALHKAEIPTIVRLSDFGMVCPEAHFSRNGMICHDCLEKGPSQSLIHKCIKGSLSVSMVNYLATRWHQWMKFFDSINAFILPTHYMARIMHSAGWDLKRLNVIPTFVDLEQFCPGVQKESIIAYTGQIRKIKGFAVLLEAFVQLFRRLISKQIKLVIAGAYIDSELKTLLLALPNGIRDQIDIAGFLSANAVAELLRKALFSVVPSVCEENFPNAALESFACGTCVIGSRSGGIPEIIDDGKNGLLVLPGDAKTLAEAMACLIENREKAIKMGLSARAKAEREYSEEKYYMRLIHLMHEIKLGN
jgi:glycosyltransferase involved in cell wall biosynthesis